MAERAAEVAYDEVQVMGDDVDAFDVAVVVDQTVVE